MNKKDFIEKLEEITKFDSAKCREINDILEDHLIIGKKGKEEIINELINRLSLTYEDANNIYNTCMELIGKGIKDKIIHPFKDQD